MYLHLSRAKMRKYNTIETEIRRACYHQVLSMYSITLRRTASVDYYSTSQAVRKDSGKSACLSMALLETAARCTSQNNLHDSEYVSDHITSPTNACFD